MNMVKVSIAEAKSHFSELVSRGAYAQEHIVITRRGKPVAALIGMDELAMLENLERSRGLTAMIDDWDDAAQVAETVEDIYKCRVEQGDGRDVSL
ncbi:MAG: type II toxin-antitoxin system Phd/YefM family antitoxin [Kiritimatiellales bacterium]|nr:type II toxin-antitoxin system Phd/YefM family antitoxin [Kiritimatiellales bacterium]